jgi:hypothetical protein
VTDMMALLPAGETPCIEGRPPRWPERVFCGSP